MRKSKGQTIDLLYTNKKEVNKKVKSKPKNTSKKKKNNTKKTQNNKERINLDNEIIIGLTPKTTGTKRDNTPLKSKVKNKKQKKSNTKKTQKNIKRKNTFVQTNCKKATTKKQNQKSKRNIKILKWITIIILIITSVILFMMSSIFNIKQIVVINNSKISSEEIINLSKLTLGINMFKTTNKTIRNNLKINAYIEDVNIKRSINGIVTLNIRERKPTYMLKFANNYVYIDIQGYMLEISENPLKLPIITGFSTPNEEIKVGNRLNTDDLNKLSDIMKIMESSKNTSLASIITEIDISKYMDYKLKVTSEKKTIRVGDMTNIGIKLQMAEAVINSEKGKTGEIYFQGDPKKAVFKEEVSR